MTRDSFRALRRGDIVKVAGNGYCVIEAAYVLEGEYNVSVRPKQFDLVIRGLSENDADIFTEVTPVGARLDRVINKNW